MELSLDYYSLLRNPVALGISNHAHQCKNKTNYTKLPHQPTIVQQTCASFMLPWTKRISQPQQQKHLYPTRLKSKALGFFANLGWTNLSGSTKQTLNQTVAKSIYSNRKCWRRYGEIWPLYFIDLSDSWSDWRPVWMIACWNTIDSHYMDFVHQLVFLAAAASREFGNRTSLRTTIITIPWIHYLYSCFTCCTSLWSTLLTAAPSWDLSVFKSLGDILSTSNE